jgi:hypothetical protein
MENVVDGESDRKYITARKRRGFDAVRILAVGV